MTLHRAIPLAVLLVAAAPVHAAGVGLRAGTLGVGADFGWEIAPTLLGRIGYSGLTYSTDVESDGVRYDAKMKQSNLAALLDWSPLGPFRLTFGIIGNDNKYDLTGQPSGGGTYTINGNPYQASDIGSLNGTIKPGKSAAPYLGIGYGNVGTAGVNFYFDLGVMFQGAPKATLSATCGAGFSTAQCAQLQNDVAAEQARLEDKVKNFKYYPVLNVGVTIGF